LNHFLDLWLKFMVNTAVYSNCSGTWYPEARSSLGLKHIAHMFRERPD
jgi:hypothetical protein